jgi:hypothetical protein
MFTANRYNRRYISRAFSKYHGIGELTFDLRCCVTVVLTHGPRGRQLVTEMLF